jgi:hypothetical protein
MAQDHRGTAVSSPVEKEPAHSASTRRMKLHRQRRRQGLRCATVPLREGQIEGLIHRGWLARAERADRAAIEKALLQYLADNLGSRATRY